MPKLPSHQDCCGCTACSSICTHEAISMIPDGEGFNYPVINSDKCVGCNQCESVCPIIKRDATSRKKNYINIYAGRIKDPVSLYKSSSGGGYFSIAKEVISKGGIVVGAEYGENCEVRHSVAETIEECAKFRGSKYAQSNITGIYLRIKELLVNGRYVLFTGTPCQVAGLKLFLRKDFIET